MILFEQLAHIFYPSILFCIGASFLFFFVLIYLNRQSILALGSEIDPPTYQWLSVIFIAALLIRIFVPPVQHIMYTDEASYMEAAKNILQTGHQGEYTRSIGWPFLLSFLFRIFGTTNWVALYSMVTIGALTTIAMFFLTFMITREKTTCILSALFICLLPAHIRWSGSAETNVISLFLICCAFFFCFLHYRQKTELHLWLALSAVCLAAQFRPENYVLFIVFLSGDLLFNQRSRTCPVSSYIAAWAFFLFLSLPNLFEILSYLASIEFMNQESQGLFNGSNWSLQNLFYNTRHYGPYILNAKFQPLFIPVFAFAGAIIFFIKEKKALALLGLWIGLFWLAYSSSWMQTLGGTTAIEKKDRFFMMLSPALIVLASSAISRVLHFSAQKVSSPLFKKTLYTGAAFLMAIAFLPYKEALSKKVRSEAHFLETKIPELAEADIPSTCLIIANYPVILRSTTDLNVMDINAFLENIDEQKKALQSSDCVLFFEDLICEMSEYEQGLCSTMKTKFEMNEYRSYSHQNHRYTFHRLLSRQKNP